ncbi:MAG: caspase family protein, partial [Burkholderiales bacterium]|nr:caspase family protein [Burkholderiales bacterium]
GLLLPPAPEVLRATLPQIGRKLAVVIGNDDYSDQRLPTLDNARSDARAVARALEKSLGYQTLVILDGSRESILATLNRVAAKTNPDDSVIIYYAGHGFVLPKTGAGYWIPSNADVQNPQTWISNADIGMLLAHTRASQVALVSDSCFSGSFVADPFKRGSGRPSDAQSLLARRAVVAMSSGGSEPVADAGREGHSPFAWYLMQGIEKVSTWQPGYNLFERVRYSVARELPQRPQYGAARFSGGGDDSDYVFEERRLAGASN